VSWFPQVGDTVGRYRITDVLGQGGMGVVFVGVAPDLERPVALKVLAPQAAADPRLRERFAREAATLARLDSPHIVYILEYGEQDGCPYLVTQLVPGGDLRRYVEDHGPLSPRQAADVMQQVAAGLEEAHAQGVVHRDLKSANVLLRELPGGQLHAYLCDFGIARADSHETTSASGVVGTLEYLAPERQSGAAASPATDIYSLGCLLWAAVTGAPPYRGTDVDVTMAHLRAPVPRLPGDDPVSRRTNAVVARAMAKKPDDRYASAHEVRQELVALAALAAEQEAHFTQAAAPAPWRHPTPVVFAGVAVAAALVVAAAVWLLPDPDRDPSDAGSSPRQSQAPRSTPAADQRRCWDGRAAETAAGCSTPSGMQGLLWVYPSFKQDRVACQRVAQPLSPRKVLAYFCPFNAESPDEGIRYSEWVSASAAREIITRDFRPWPEAEVEQEGSTWSVWIREDRDEQGSFSSAVAYRDWPFSAEVVSNTKRAAILACNFIELRAPDTYRRVTALCDSSG
jgi:serine/threonine protein kinase